MSFVYLGCPYSHPLAAIRALRFAMVNEYAARLMQDGHVVFSPISHTHPIADYLEVDFLMDHDFWMRQDLPILERASRLIVLRLPGWEKSRGVVAEIDHAEKCGIPVEYADHAKSDP